MKKTRKTSHRPLYAILALFIIFFSCFTFYKEAVTPITVRLPTSNKISPTITTETHRDSASLEATFSQRKKIYQHGCKFVADIQALMISKPQLDTLLDFHRQIFNLENPERKVSDKCRRYPHRDNTSVRIVNKYGIAMCLPPKCGTSNWQRALIALQEGTSVDNISAKGIDLYRTLAHYKPGDDVKYKVANTRNPFTRLYSAWNDKSRTATKSDGKTFLEGLTPKRKRQLRQSGKQFHEKYFPGQKLFEHQPPPDGRNVSWESFVKYVSANDGDAKMNWHWQLQHHQCQVQVAS